MSDASLCSPVTDVEAAKDAMLGFLFRGLTATPQGGTALFDALTRTARQPHWYIEGGISDTLDGRFATVATVIALALARIEEEPDSGNTLAVALTERFIEVMESEHRELGLGDPTLGKTVRKLVAMLARRTDLWRAVRAGELAWAEAARSSLYGEPPPAAEALGHTVDALRQFNARLSAASLADLAKGEIA